MISELASIVMPYYNAGKYINETVSAIIAQTYTNWELLIVDDCSSVTETHILQQVASMDKRIRILRTQTNSGAGVARNIGVIEAAGRYVAFCDADDWWYPTKLEEQIQFMQSNNYPFSCTWYEDSDEHLESFYITKPSPKQSYRDMLFGCTTGPTGVVIDVKLLGKKLIPNLRRAEDWGLWLLYLQETGYLYTYPKVLWKYRHIRGSVSSNKLKQLKGVKTMYQQIVGMNNISAFFVCIFVFLPRNIFKKIRKKLHKR